MPRVAQIWLGAVLSLVFAWNAVAAPLAAPGDMQLRHDLQLLNDSGVINIPLTAWPVPLGDVYDAVADSAWRSLSATEMAALERVRDYLSWELETGIVKASATLAGSSNPRVIRTFENTPREDAQASANLHWVGDRFAVSIQASYAPSPIDGNEFRPDGTYFGAAFGNWIITAGWQDRWWGPSRDGSLILSSNARPTPGLMLQRNNSTPFRTKWLSWLGPWTLTTFMSELDDDRTVKDALLFGVRGSIRPPKTGLEIAISRTAQWCGVGRPCNMSVFVDLLLGNDNQGVNVDPEDEPGNQLGGVDIRWTLPRKLPIALYMQWIGEDSRGGGGAIGSWLRQVGIEHWGTLGSLSHRTHFEVSHTSCKQGSSGLSDDVPNCAYEHSIYQTGYRYRGRPLGHGIDGDGLSYSIGSTLVQSGGATWNISIRQMELNRIGVPNTRHTLTPTPVNRTDFQVSWDRITNIGHFYAGAGYGRSKDMLEGRSDSEFSAFLLWSSQ